ncbi:EAL domain-containing protein (plasmid) [Deinococcus radiomollis]|uniref:putative bifunctional diguanylate cyclase/phosphodiesterase n=1 Tax=Deinococcus radiomollis TaxID=468916 RepID=UPI003892C964
MTLSGNASPGDLEGTDVAFEEGPRLAALHRYGVLDTLPEPQFDGLVRLASRVFNLPMALISFVDEHRQWVKASEGVPFSETPRCESFCAHTIAQDGVMVVPDAHLHRQLRTSMVVLDSPFVRSYAGAPLVTPDGHKIGTFCVLSPEPREFSEEEQRLLTSFAELVMTELKLRQAFQDLADTALNDTLTGLPNRVQFRQLLVAACRHAALCGEKVVVGLLDLDGFKLINDTFGHAVGDEVLREVGRRLKEANTAGNTVARLSGDEFVLLLTDVRSAADIRRVTRRLEDRFAAPFMIGGQEVFVRWSLGLSIFPDNAQGPDALLSHADAAMYRVKRAGGGHTMFQARQDQRSPLEIERLGALHRALERGELRVYFQPVVLAETRAVVAHEALLRWARPSGMVSPLDFIPLAESSGLIVPIGRWVLQEAVGALQTGRLQRASVNVSALEVKQPDFVAYLRGLLSESGITPRRLLLELTESSLLEPRFGKVIRELQSLGVRTALDDFGNGYSSLTALSNLPVQVVKIDRSFATRVGEDSAAGRKALEVVRGIVTLAGAYGLPTVAEGVETAGQAELLRAVGCTYLQGYLFGYPAPLD